MAQQKQKSRAKKTTGGNVGFDGVYLLKLVLYLLLGSIWLKIQSGSNISFPIPVGLIVGLILTTHEHFQIDRKIEYAVLLVAMLFGYFAPYGLFISF